MIRNVILILENIRDLIIQFLPGFVARLLVGKGEFAFIVHPRDLSDAKRKYPFAAYLPKSVIEIWSRFQWPTIGSKIHGLVTRTGRKADGWVIICPMTTRLMIKNRNVARNRVLQAVKLSEKLGSKIVGLGAFTSIVTRDGRSLKGKTRVGITTGNAYSAAIAIENLKHLFSLTGRKLIESSLAVVGGAGSVGSACSKILAKSAKELIIVDKNKRELDNLIDYINMGNNIKGRTDIASIKKADGIIAVTNAPGAIVRASHLKKGAIVIDAAQPKNVSRHIPNQRDDVIVVESAIVKSNGLDFNFDFGLNYAEALGCLAEVLVLAWMEHKGDYSLGKVDPSQVEEILSVGNKVGFKLADFRNSCGIITFDKIQKIREIVESEKSP
jgi:predicted amino acid dehydrogenase